MKRFDISVYVLAKMFMYIYGVPFVSTLKGISKYPILTSSLDYTSG